MLSQFVKRKAIKMTKCTTYNCPMKHKCKRAEFIEENDDDYVEFYNFEYTCNEFSGFEDFVSKD